MTVLRLYTGGGVSMSPRAEAGRRVSEFVRVVADDGMAITDGTVVTNCVDTRTPENWTDCSMPVMEVYDEFA